MTVKKRSIAKKTRSILRKKRSITHKIRSIQKHKPKRHEKYKLKTISSSLHFIVFYFFLAFFLLLNLPSKKAPIPTASNVLVFFVNTCFVTS